MDSGALCAFSGAKTGRSPSDKRIVEDAGSKGDVWWGAVNVPLTQDSFQINRERALNFLATKDMLYGEPQFLQPPTADGSLPSNPPHRPACPSLLLVIDGYAGWDRKYQLKIRVVTSRAYHALFMRNMLIRPTPSELAEFGRPGKCCG